MTEVIDKAKAVYRYYTLYRPPMPGGIPHGAVNVQTLGSRPYFSEVGHTVWGYVDYDRMLTPKEIRDYELAPANTVQQPLQIAL